MSAFNGLLPQKSSWKSSDVPKMQLILGAIGFYEIILGSEIRPIISMTLKYSVFFCAGINVCLLAMNTEVPFSDEGVRVHQSLLCYNA